MFLETFFFSFFSLYETNQIGALNLLFVIRTRHTVHKADHTSDRMTQLVENESRVDQDYLSLPRSSPA